MTVYWMVWDAAANWVVERLDAEGRLPSVRRLRSGGLWAAARPPAPNCQTPPSLATLFTGTWPHEHGVTGFRVPAGRAGESVSGFARSVCARPMVWETAGRGGRHISSVHAPWVVNAADGGAPRWLDGAVEAYSGQLARHGAHELTGRPVTFPVADHTLSAVADGEGIRVRGPHGDARVTDRWAQLKLDAASGIWVRQARARGRRLLLHTGAWVLRAVGHDGRLVTALRGAPVFAGGGLGSCYRAGMFGPRLVDGGDGGAEDLFVSSVNLVGRGFEAAVARVLELHRSDLVVMYLPITDDAGHELLGWCDERSAAHRPDVAQKVWRHVARCYRRADAILGRVLDRAEGRDTVVLCADHGIAGTAWTLYPNRLLVDGGLAVVDAAGRLDAARSAAYYHPANNGSLWMNAGVVERVARLLGSVLAPGTDRPLIRGLRPSPDGRRVDLLFDPDCLPSAALPGDGRPVGAAAKPAAHVTNCGDERLHAVFAAAGPGLPRGRRLGVIDNTWPAELVLDRLLTPLPTRL